MIGVVDKGKDLSVKRLADMVALEYDNHNIVIGIALTL